MATKQEGSSRPTDKQRYGSLSNFSRNLGTSWIGRNWQTALLLVLLVFLALFVRSYFGYSTSVDNGFLVSGGSDSYYHMRVIDHVVDTGQHLLNDNLLNYPYGMRNPRPPLYDWSVAVAGMFASSMTGMEITDAVGLSLIFSTAVWGALTVVPVFLIGKAAFGRKAGILGAFLFALMPGHIERSVLSNADHDSMALFFVVFAFYFLLRSLQSVSGTNWVSSWKNGKAISSGVKTYFGTNQASLLYASLGGMCLASVAMIWTGYTYVMIVVLVYLLVQLLVDRFRNSDSMGVMFSFTTFFAVAFLVMAPVYIVSNLVVTWFDTPLFMFAAGLVLAILFVITRDYPWTLVLPAFAVLAIAALAALSVISPTFFESIISGQGYLVKSKLYDTISEAQAPLFSSLAMSFGMVTFWLSLIGVGLAAYKIPKNISPYFIFVVVWVGISIYMASSAARFVFNASPAFAVSAGWILALIIDRLKFNEMIRNLQGDHGGIIKNIRHSIKLRHVLGAVFIVLMILVPNVWYAMDAGIPSDSKADYDRQIYLAMPGFMRPGDYDVENGTNYYLGAFSYGMSLPNEYWPTAWKWFAQQDNNITSVANRPAYLSWWDYGFEALQEGGHPAVADNFQNGYQFAGSFLMTQTEEGAIALLVVRCVEGSMEDTNVLAALESHGVDVVRFKDIMVNPADYVDEVKDNPDIYGEYDDELSAGNAMYAAAREELSQIGKDNLVSLYNEVRELTGNDIGYISIDSRLFPFSATSYNIFYAPAKLSDQRVDGNNIPYDYYVIYAVDYYGQRIALEDVTADDLIVDYEIVYNEAFYDTMLYRTFMGYGPSDVGETEQGIPGISGSLASMPSMQGWNMTNFRMVYRTAYYNPYPSTEVANHTDAWIAISYEDGIDLYNQISAGTAIGTVDLSSSSLYQGVVFLQYYDGAIVEGTAVSDSGRPMADIWVTVIDEYGIPHQVVKTDANGHYSVIAPFGQTRIVFSYGELDARQLIGTELYSTALDITYDQAMRVEADLDKDGQLDYLIDLDPIITAGSLSGQVFIDNDADGEYSAAVDKALVGATVVFENQTNSYRAEAITTANGYDMFGLSPMGGSMWVDYQGHVFGETKVTVEVDDEVVTDFAVEPATVNGTISLQDGSAANGITISLLDQTNGQAIETTTDASGDYSFGGLLPGNYTIQTPDGTVVQDAEVSLSAGDAEDRDLVLYESMRLTGLVSFDGEAVSNAMIGVSGDLGTTWVKSDSRGRYSVVLPKGDASIYATASVDGQEVVYLSHITTTESATLDLQLTEAVVLSGTVRSSGNAVASATVRLESRTSGAVFNAVTNASGNFLAVLPVDTYFAYVHDQSRSYWGDIILDSSKSLAFDLVTSAKITGRAWFDANGDGAITTGETLNGVVITVTDQSGRSVSVSTSSTGYYSLVLVSGKSYTLTANKNGYDQVLNSYVPLDVSVTADLKMLATERLVSGTISPGLSGVTISFTAQGGSAVSKTTVTGTGGTFTLSLAPGDYSIGINQNVTPGDVSVKYQMAEGRSLTVAIGNDPAALTIEMVQRVLVSGTISPGGTANLVFDGPERTAVSASGTYSVYLQLGDYSLYVRVDNSSLRSADLSLISVIAPMTHDVSAATAAQAAIRVEIADINTKSVNVSIEQGGAYYNVTTSTAGLVTVYLASGTYTASVDHHALAQINLVDRYVRYTGEATFEMTGTLKNVIISTIRTLDNATVAGQVLSSGVATAASLQFQAISETGMDLSVETLTGDYSIELAPGNYSVYVVSLDHTRAFLGTMTVSGIGAFDHDIVLVEAFRLSGVTFVDDVGVGAQMSVTGAGEHTFSSAADGSYELYLPAGTYRLTAETELIETGAQVNYAGIAEVTVNDVMSKGIVMYRETERDVEVTWDSSQKATLSAGQTATYTIRVVNTGNVEDTFRLTTSGTGWTVVLSQTTVTLGFGTENSQIVTVQITPASTVLVKHTAVTVRATSTTNSSATDSVSLDATITPMRSVGLTYQSAKATDGASYLYTVRMSNLGNIDDTYTVTIGNVEALRELGWEVKLVGESGLSDSQSLAVAASKTSDLTISLVPLRENPSPTISVQVLAVSQSDEAVKATLDMDPKFVGLNTGGLSVTGDGVSDSMPKLGDDTIILVGAAFTLMAVLIVLIMQKGVLSRRKR